MYFCNALGAKAANKNIMVIVSPPFELLDPLTVSQPNAMLAISANKLISLIIERLPRSSVKRPVGVRVLLSILISYIFHVALTVS